MFWDNYLRLCNTINKAPNVVAAEIGIKSSGTVTGWRKGSLPRQNVLIKIADYFGVSVSDLLSGHTVVAEEPDDVTLEEAKKDLRDQQNTPACTDDAVRFALFGGGDVTDEMMDEVKNFAKFVMERERNRSDRS